MAILFGITRTTDDIDVIVGETDGSKVYQRCVECGYELLTSRESVVEEYAIASIRFFKPPRLLPTFELKPPRAFPQQYALENRVSVRIGGKIVYISPIELQIAYKLKLGSDKDVEDALFLYKALKSYIEEEELNMWLRTFGVSL
ncbi:MAG: hypothetical protein ABWK05_03060 [Pyrobaculum sp.]